VKENWANKRPRLTENKQESNDEEKARIE